MDEGVSIGQDNIDEGSKISKEINFNKHPGHMIIFPWWKLTCHTVLAYQEHLQALISTSVSSISMAGLGT
jgi:hypothetical protein